jgi:hypothetical protein
MIIMINGSFGVGKSTVAAALVERLPEAMLFDPEDVGQLARYITRDVRPPAEDTDDFQDIAIWPPLVVATAQQLLHHYRRRLVVPMTLAKRPYFDAIRGGFAALGLVQHFCLVAPLPVVQHRLLARGDAGPGSWPWRKAEEYVPLLHDPYFVEHIDTEQHSVDDVVNHILARIAEE